MVIIIKKVIILLSILIVSCFLSIDNKCYASFSDSSRSSIVMNMDDNMVLYEKNSHERLLPASITKIMTCIIAIEYGKLDDYYLVTNDVSLVTGSSIYLKSGEKIKLIDALYGMMLRSGNDAAYFVSKCVSNKQSDFVYLMNSKAKELNMHNTFFKNPTGLDEEDENYSSAHDMAVLMSYAMKNKTFRKIVSSKHYNCSYESGNNLSFANKHKLVLNNEYVTGGKTGYTKKAKRTLVTTFKKDDINIVTVTFDCSDDWSLHESLFDYVINNYSNVILLKKGIIDLNNVNYPFTPIIYEDVSYLIKEKDKLTCNVELSNKILNDNIIGICKVYVNKHLVKEVKIYRYY